MFKRRHQLPRLDRLREWIWPKRGWVRAGIYVAHRLSRLPDSGYSIACGFACGAAISFTPFVGLHLILGGGMAWLLRANIFAAWIGTLVGNPWTFPFIWLWLYKSGNWILARNGDTREVPPDFVDVFSGLWEALLVVEIDAILTALTAVILPMAISGIPSFIVVWIAFYFPMKKLVEGYKRRRRRRILRKRKRRIAKAAGNAPMPTDGTTQ